MVTLGKKGGGSCLKESRNENVHTKCHQCARHFHPQQAASLEVLPVGFTLGAWVFKKQTVTKGMLHL